MFLWQWFHRQTAFENQLSMIKFEKSLRTNCSNLESGTLVDKIKRKFRSFFLKCPILRNNLDNIYFDFHKTFKLTDSKWSELLSLKVAIINLQHLRLKHSKSCFHHLFKFSKRVKLWETSEFSKFVTLIISIFSLKMFHVAWTTFLLRLFEKEFTALQNQRRWWKLTFSDPQESGKCCKLKTETLIEISSDHLQSRAVKFLLKFKVNIVQKGP